jgi:hypothetical protein
MFRGTLDEFDRRDRSLSGFRIVGVKREKFEDFSPMACAMFWPEGG